MGKISIAMPDELEERFRKAAMKKFGMKKGNLSDAAVEAIELWLKEKG